MVKIILGFITAMCLIAIVIICAVAMAFIRDIIRKNRKHKNKRRKR